MIEKLLGANDWTGHQMREERDEVVEILKTCDRLEAIAIDVDRVAHRAERVKTNADRQDQRHVWKSRLIVRESQSGTEIIEREVEVFEEP